MIRRRPLMRMATRAAVVGGASYAGTRMAANAAQRQAAEQQAQYDAQQQAYQAGMQAAAGQPAPTTAEPAEDPTLAQLQKYADLHKSGVLTDEEFATAKAKLLAGL